MKGKKTLPLSLIVMLVVSMAMLGVGVSAVPPPYPAISVEPSLVEYVTDVPGEYLGTEFTVEVKVWEVTDYYGCDFWLYYNETLLEKVAITVDGPGQVAPTDPSKRSIGDNSVPGTVKFSGTFVYATGATPFTGNGTVAWITFKIIYSPEQLIVPQDYNEVNSTLTFATFWTVWYKLVGTTPTEETFDALHDGFYSYKTLSIFPTTLFVHPSVSTVVIGETFKIGVIVNNVIDLYSFEFKLGYNTTILDVIEVWVMWPDFYVINETAGIVWVSASCPYPYPFSGNGTLAAITFTATGLGSYVLDLHDTTLVDFYARPIAHDAVDGYAAVTPIHDVAIVNVVPSATEAYPTWTVPLDIMVVVINEGAVTETFNVTVYYNLTATEWLIIGNETVTNLAVGENKTLTFSWNVIGLSVGTYVINATANLLPSEVDTGDNTLTSTVNIRLPGDVDGNGKVTGLDQIIVGISLWTKLGDIDYNPYADLNGDGKVTGLDQIIVGIHLWETV